MGMAKHENGVEVRSVNSCFQTEKNDIEYGRTLIINKGTLSGGTGLTDESCSATVSF